MANVNWNILMAITPEKMTEEEKDEFYESAAWLVPEENVDKKNIIHFVRITQEILKYKAELVDSLMNELDELAARQGEEEAIQKQSLLEEIEELKEQLRYQEKLGQGTDMNDKELRTELIKLEIQNEELVLELQEKEKDLMNEKSDGENLASQVAKLEKEKLNLTRELAVLQDEANERLYEKSRDSPEFGAEKLEELTEVIKQKNKHISQLLIDVETVEEENISLRNKLTTVRDALAEATGHISEMTSEITKLKHQGKNFEEKIVDLERQNVGLKHEIEDLVKDKENHDKDLDNFATHLNGKMEEWKQVMVIKDSEILKLKEELKKVKQSSNFPALIEMTETGLQEQIETQSKQIKLLEQELLKATQELNTSAEIIEKLHTRQVSEPLNVTSGVVAALEEKIAHLEAKLKYAEEDAQSKAEEMSELVIMVKEFEAGEYGLAQSHTKIKKLTKTIQKKDLQIEKLVESCNYLEIKSENFAEQNMVLREKLGLTAEDGVDTSQVKLKYKRDMEIISALKVQIEKKEEEIIKIKLKNRKLLKLIKSSKDEDSESVTSVQESKVKRQEKEDVELKLEYVVKENDALRKGMHEILESIQSQDGEGLVEVQSQCLERLLEALDTRHISGWYHPAMRLQAQLSNTEGKLQELRNQIRSMRSGNAGTVEELQSAFNKIQDLEKIIVLQQAEIETQNVNQDGIKVEQVEDANTTTVQRNIHEENRIIELEIELEQLQSAFQINRTELRNMDIKMKRDKEELDSQKTIFKTQIKELKLNPGVVEQVVSNTECEVFRKKVEILQRFEETLWGRCYELSYEHAQTSAASSCEVVQLMLEKSKMIMRIDELEQQLLKSVSKDKLEELKKEVLNIEAKYHSAVSVQLTIYSDPSVEKLQQEIAMYESEKQSILNDLRETKEKLINTEAMMSIGNAVTQDVFNNELSLLAAKLATSEVREINEKNKASHLEKMCLMAKAENQELEIHNKELMKCVGELTELNSRHQGRELQLEETRQVVPVPSEQTNLQDKVKELQNEKQNLQELLDISQNQCRALQCIFETQKQYSTSLNDQLLTLQVSSDDRTTIARLSHELVTTQLERTELRKKNSDIQDKFSKLMTDNLVLQTKIDKINDDKRESDKKHAKQVEDLEAILFETRRLFIGVVPFPYMNDIYNLKLKLRDKQMKVGEKLTELQSAVNDYLTKREEMEVQLESLNELRGALTNDGESNNLISWHNKITEVKLKEARFRRQNDFLRLEIAQLQHCVKTLNAEIADLEEKCLKTESNSVLHNNTAADTEQQPTIDHGHEDLTNQIQELELRVFELEHANSHLQKVIDERNSMLMRKKSPSPPKTLELEEVVSRDRGDETEKLALQMTIESLQKVIEQKEETILRYQDLLKEGRNESNRTCEKLEAEVRNISEALAGQQKAYKQLKQNVQVKLIREGSTVAVEKYITKIHELEDELTDCESTILDLRSQVQKAAEEVEHWKAVADDRLTVTEGLRQGLELEYKQEIEGYRAEVEQYQLELEQMKQLVMPESRDARTQKLLETINLLQLKLSQYQSKPNLLDEPTDQGAQNLKETESLRRQLASSKEETTRLREQLRLLQLQKSKRPSSSSTQASRSSLKEENLQSKIKTLEELLKLAKEKELELAESEQKKIKSAEEVARWDERKRSRQALDRLSMRLKDKEVEVEVVKSKNESLRNMVHKHEKEKHTMEVQIRALRGSNKIDKLVEENSRLQEELSAVKIELEEHVRHSSGTGAALLHDKLEQQERKLAVLELAKQGHSPCVEELERLKIANHVLEKENLKLETENLSANLKLEKIRGELTQAMEKVKHLEVFSPGYRDQSQRSQERSPRLITSTEKLRRDLNKAREELKELQGRYLAAVERSSALENELTKCRYQIRLLEEKDMAESISKTNHLELANEISQELAHTKAQLAHKSHLLDKVKVLLKKAAAKEKVLNDQVLALQSLVPKPF